VVPEGTVSSSPFKPTGGRMTVLENALESLGLLEKYLAEDSHPYDVEDWLNYIGIALEATGDLLAALKELAAVFNVSKRYDPDKFTAREWVALQNTREVISKMKGGDIDGTEN
jgi:hypothetical protein